jgi:F-type H+-transporting ATPase subunit epsilon
MKLEILTPRKIEYQGDAEDVVLPTLAGEIGVLSRHTPLVSVLKPGKIIIKTKKEELIINVDGGILEVADNHGIILLKNFHVQKGDVF